MSRQTLFRLPLVFVVVLALLGALWAALMRVGWRMPPLPVPIAGYHGALMISAFLGTLVSLERALALDPNSPAVRGLRGLYFQRVGNFRQALTEFQAAAALEPNNPTWLVSIGESYAKLGDLIRALEAYKAAAILAPEDASYWRLLAIFCGQNNVNITDIGVPAAQKAVILTKGDVPSLDVLGWLLILDSQYQEAERMLDRALELDSQNASVHFHLGMLYLQTNERARAYDHLVQARDLGNVDAEAFLSQYFP